MRFLTAGESHGPELTVILEGLPAGIPLTTDDIDFQLARRQKGEGSGGRMAIEQDRVRITGGVMAGCTTGAPISMVISNKDFAAWVERDIAPMTIPRPGHADLTAALKYGYRDLRLGLERASARETAARVAMGAVCRMLLQNFEIVIGSYVLSIGSVQAVVPADSDFATLLSRAEASPVRCPDEEAGRKMLEEIAGARAAGDTLGGVLDCVALNLPPGLGSHIHWDRRLTTRLMAAVGSIPAIKGVQFGNAFGDAASAGTDVHDEILCDSQGTLSRASNRAGGLEGGITTGQPLIVRAAMKPISTTMKGLGSVDLATGQPARTVYERSDICAVPRACIVAEAMVSFVLADALMEKLGGDSLDEMAARYKNLRRSTVGDLPMDSTSWRFGYKTPDSK
ncbi:MAG: chorismate synthase [Desulfomonile tiedjei]|nr:chorismate synthase [Desulfomonile tiedjei]